MQQAEAVKIKEAMTGVIQAFVQENSGNRISRAVANGLMVDFESTWANRVMPMIVPDTEGQKDDGSKE